MMFNYYTSVLIMSWLALGVLSILVYENDRLMKSDKRILYSTYAIVALSGNTIRYIYNNKAHKFSGTTGGAIAAAATAGDLRNGTASADALINLADSNAVNYAVLYVPYNSFKEYTGTFNITSGTVEYKGLNSEPQKNAANWVLNGKTTVDQTAAQLVSADFFVDFTDFTW